MSTVVVATVKSNSSSPPAFQDTSGTEIGRLCRAFVNFDGTGVVAIRAQFNVSSITDNGTGDYTVNFTTAMTDGNYSIACTPGQTGSPPTNGAGPAVLIINKIIGTTSSCNIQSLDRQTTVLDSQIINFAIFR